MKMNDQFRQWVFNYSLIAMLLAASVNLSTAAIDPIFKECMQRGYEIVGDSCQMPDGTKCLLQDFNEGKCGEVFFNAEYCIPKGGYVWDGPCCKGLTPYLPANAAGQKTCQDNDLTKWFYDNEQPIMIGIVITIILGAAVGILVRRRRNEV